MNVFCFAKIATLKLRWEYELFIPIVRATARSGYHQDFA
jgi:hypothetical protein